MSTSPIHLLAAFLTIGLASCAKGVREPVNLSKVKDEIKVYVNSGSYDSEVKRVADSATIWVEKRTAKPGEKLAIILDIDETTLSNLAHMREEDWGYQPKIWDEWVMTSTAPAIIPVREVYRKAIAKNVTVFFLTGRKESDRAPTARHLKSQGMGTYQTMITRPNSGPKPAAVVFKTAHRARIEQQGFTIIANVGDQASDLDGGYSERVFKLPNPFYFIR